MPTNDEHSRANSPDRSRICRVRGHSGLYRVLKLYARRARVVLADQPDEVAFLIKKTELRDLSAIDPEPHLFLDPTEVDPSFLLSVPPTVTEEQPAILPPLPYGLFDLDPCIVTDPGPPFRVRCFVQGCQHLLRPPTRGFRGQACPQHGVRCHYSGSSATYTYTRPERNIIASPHLFTRKLLRNPHKFETHRFGYENSEDAVSWNVFRSLQEAGCLHDIARHITGLEILTEPTLYLWGLRMSDDSLELWELLDAARDYFETNRLPVKRPATEPDIALHLKNKYLVLIEAKLGSGNPSYSEGPRKNGQSLTKDELLDLYRDPGLQILDVDRARAADRIFYQLWRNMVFAEYMAMLDSPTTLAFHANLVRAGCEHESCSAFRQLLRPGYQDRFTRLTWEEIHTLTGLHWRRLSRVQEYLMTKTLGLSQAFQLDVW
jgi:hypothetical protein